MLKYCISLVFIGVILGAYQQWRSKATSLVVGPRVSKITQHGLPLKLAAIGDYGTGKPEQFAVFAALETYCQESGLDALLLLGDNIYMDGVSSVDDPKWESVIRKPFEYACLSQLPLLPVLGNHDYKGNTGAQIAYSKIWENWRFPARFYSVQFSDLLEVVAIDSNIFDYCGSADHCSGDFLRERKAARSTRWQIAMGHHPANNSLSKHKPGLIGWVLQKATCGLDLYLAGHNHHLEHLSPNDCPNTEYLISGAAGASIYDIKERAQDSQFAESQYGFLVLSIEYSALSFSFYDLDQNVLYRRDSYQVAETNL